MTSINTCDSNILNTRTAFSSGLQTFLHISSSNMDFRCLKATSDPKPKLWHEKDLVFCSGLAWASNCTAENPGVTITSPSSLPSHSSSHPPYSLFLLIVSFKPSFILHTCFYTPDSVSKLIAPVFLAAPSSVPRLPSRSGPEWQPNSHLVLAVLWVYFFAICGRLFVLFCPSALPFSDFLIKSSGNWIFSSHCSCLWLSLSSVPLNVCLDYLLQFQPSLFSISFLLLSFRVSLCFDHQLLLKLYDRSSVSLLTSWTNLVPYFCQVLSVWLLNL